MADRLKTIATREQKKTLRRITSISPITSDVVNIVADGCKKEHEGAYLQFIKDVLVYGLWEALLFVELYEKDGVIRTNYYDPGTAYKAFTAINGY